MSWMSLVGPGLGFLSDMLGRQGQKDANDEAMARYGSQIQTRVADARAAGISPLAALGMPGSSPASFQLPGSRGGVESGLEHVGQMASDWVAQREARRDSQENRAERREEREHRVRMDKARAETDAVRAQAAATSAAAAHRQATLYGTHLAAQREARGNRPIPAEATTDPRKLYMVVDDRFPTAGPGQRVIMDPELAEAFEAIPMGVTATDRITAGSPASGKLPEEVVAETPWRRAMGDAFTSSLAGPFGPIIRYMRRR